MSEDKKSARRLAREVALQGLYEWRMSGNSLPMIEEHLAQACEAWARADRPLAMVLLRGATGDADALESSLAAFIDRPLSEISPVERAILLLGAYELTHRIETPYRVVMNEAIELAKDFGGTDGHRYINGVLDKFAPTVRAAEVEHAAKQRKPRS